MSRAVYAILTSGISILNKPEVGNVTCKDMKHLSAETNLISGWIQSGYLHESAEVTLLHSDTDAGRTSVGKIQYYLSRIYPDLSLKTMEIEALDMSTIRQGLEGMYQFIRVLTDVLTRYPSEHTLFGPVGGYKSMTALAYSLAVSYGHPIWYIHETMGRPVALPSLPMTFDQSVFEIPEIRQMIKQFAYGIGYDWRNCILEEELSVESRQLIKKYPLLFYRMDELVAISPLARTYIEGRAELWRLPIHVRQKKLLSNKTTLRLVRSEFEKFYQGEKNEQWTRRFQHERQLKKTKDRGWPYSLYRMENKRYSYRALYRLSDDGELYLYHVWEQHGDYEREINKSDFSKHVAPFDAKEYTLVPLDDCD